MKLMHQSRAGSVESGDILIMLKPAESGVRIHLESKVMVHYGEQIELLIKQTLSQHGISDCSVIAKDSGALDYTIRSRVNTAVKRSVMGGVK